MTGPLSEAPDQPVPGRQDLSVSMEKANLYAGVFIVPVLVISGGLWLLRWGWAGAAAGLEHLLANTLPFAVACLAGILVHELIHGLAWVLFGRKPYSAIRFGFQLATLTPYAHVKEPLEVNAYRIGTFLPGLLLGILPTLVGIALGDGLVTAFGTFFTLAAAGDFLILWLIRKVPAGRLVEDHPTRAGCYVLEI